MCSRRLIVLVLFHLLFMLNRANSQVRLGTDSLSKSLIDTVNGTIRESAFYSNGTKIEWYFQMENGFPLETIKYDKNGNLEYKITYKRSLFTNFHKNAKWRKKHYSGKNVIRVEKGKGVVFILPVKT